MEIDLSKLKKPFPEKDIEWRIAFAGTKQDGNIYAQCLAYISNRDIQDRLDDVCGIANWQNQFIPYHMNNKTFFLCGISIHLSGNWITKWDGSDVTDFEAIKGGISGAMKRAGAEWGIGRYLYGLTEAWAHIGEQANGEPGKFRQNADKNKKYPAFRWSPPPLPLWATPEGGLLKNEQIKEYCKANKFTQKEIKEFLKEYDYNLDGIMQVITNKENKAF